MAGKEKQTITAADVATMPAGVFAKGLVDPPKPEVKGTGTVQPPSPARAAAYAEMRAARETAREAAAALQVAVDKLAAVDAAEKLDAVVAKMTPEEKAALKARL